MRPKAVLVVDDDEAILPILEVTLRASGYRVVATTRPAEAVDAIERESIDILISDVDMPVMDGLELVSRVKQRFPWVVRILLTAHGTIDVAMAAINRGEVFRFITKPWVRKDLMVTLESACVRSDELRAQAALARANALREAKLEELESRYPGITALPREEREERVHALDDERLAGIAAYNRISFL